MIAFKVKNMPYLLFIKDYEKSLSICMHFYKKIIKIT